MTTLTTIEIDQLAAVVGGVCNCCCSVDVQQGGAPAGADPGASAQPAAPSAGAGASAGGGGFLQGLQAFLQFLQSPQFNQIVGGASQILTGFAGQNAGSTGAAPQQGATAQA